MQQLAVQKKLESAQLESSKTCPWPPGQYSMSLAVRVRDGVTFSIRNRARIKVRGGGSWPFWL